MRQRYTRSTVTAKRQSGMAANRRRAHRMPCRKAQDAIPEKPTRSSQASGSEKMNEATRIAPAALELGSSGEEFQNFHELIRKARANLNQNTWDYIVGA